MEKLGILLSRDSIRQVEDLQDSLTTLSTATFGAANALLVSLAPALERVVTGLTETITAEVEARGGFQEFGQFLKEEFLGLLQKTITGIVGIYNAFAILINGIMDSAAAIGLINNDIHSLKKNLAEFKEIEGNGFLENFFDLSNWQMSAGRAGDILEKELGSGFLLTKDNVSKAIAILERELTKAENEGKVGLNLPLIDAEDITGALTFLEDLKGKSTEAATNVAEVITTGTQGTLHFLDAALNKVFGVDRVDKFFSETEEYAEKAVLSIGDFIKITFEMMGEDMKMFFEGIAEAVRNSGLGDATKTLAEGFIKAGQLLEQSLTDAVLTGKASFSDLADHIKQVLAKALIQKFITGPLLAMIPGLASGGPATAGKPYVVGEEGPELFVPTASGTVIPNDEMTSGGSGMGGATNVTYNIQATDAASFKSLVARDPEFIYNVSRAGQRRQPA